MIFKTIRQLILKRFLILLFISARATTLHAQQDQAVKDLIENIAEGLPDDYDLSELTEQLDFYKKHPIDLNHTTPEELKNMIFLSPLQISNFFTHLHTSGKLLDLLELQSIDGFDSGTIDKLLPFVTLNVPTAYDKLSFKNLAEKGNNDLILRYTQTLQTQKGFTNLPGSRYLGSPEKLLGKYRYTYSDLISASLVFKKDAGEYLFSGNNKVAFDFMSAHFAVNNLGKIKKLVVGDYTLQFGQGLTLWSGFGYGKGPDVTSVAKKDVGLKAYTSSNESSFFRGAAGTITLFDNISVTPFVSFRKLDASLSEKTGEPTLVNLGVSGLHRTATEIKNKKSEGQLIYGTDLQYTSDNLNIGTVVYHSHYQHPFVTGTQAYNQQGFTGNQLNNAGLYYNYTFKNIYFYGEAASSLDGGASFINGAMASLSHILSVVLVYRNYSAGYHCFFGQGIGEGGEASNEKGFYAGLNVVPNKQWSFAVYNDYFSFPWLKYRIDAPSAGYEILAQLSYTPSKRFKAVARFKTKLKSQNPDDPAEETLLDKVNTTNYRLQTDWHLGKKISLQNRVEIVRYKKGPASPDIGYLVDQDIDYSPLSSRFSANLRFAYFNTTYNSRVYAYEDDVLYGFSFGMYNGKGFRTYLNLKYHLLKGLNLWTRYAIFIYPGVETVGSGLDLINGNKKSEIKVQLRYEF